MTISRIRGLKYFGLSVALTLAGAALALVLNLGAEAQNQTLFSDNFEDGNANGWTKPGGIWAVVSDGSLVYRQSSTSSDAHADPNGHADANSHSYSNTYADPNSHSHSNTDSYADAAARRPIRIGRICDCQRARAKRDDGRTGWPDRDGVVGRRVPGLHLEARAVHHSGQRDDHRAERYA